MQTGWIRASTLGVVLFAGCIGPPPALNESTGDTSGSTTAASTTGTPATSTTAAGSTDGADLSGTAAAGETTLAASSSSDSGTSSDTGTDTGGDPSVLFFDDFQREDSPNLGNGWLEKTPAAWQIVNGRVEFETFAAGFDDDFIFQPDLELADAEVSVSFRLSDVTAEEYPQVHARIDPIAAQVSGESFSYGVFVDILDSELLVIRNRGTDGNTLATAPFGPSIESQTDYRVTIVISGDETVQVEGFLERLADNRWVPQAQIFALDDSNDRISEPGAVGTSGNFNIANLAYDDFTVRDPTPDGP